MLLTLAIFAVGLIAWGCASGRVPTDPFCARCRFSLVGLPEPLTRCPECGRDLAAPGAVRRSRSPFRRGWLLAGAAVLLALAPAAFLERLAPVSHTIDNAVAPCTGHTVASSASASATLARRASTANPQPPSSLLIASTICPSNDGPHPTFRHRIVPSLPTTTIVGNPLTPNCSATESPAPPALGIE